MMQRLLLLLISIAFFSGGALARSIEKVSADRKLALISAIDPTMRGQKIGITVFQSKYWTAESTGFDVNAAILSAIKANLNRDVKLINGLEAGLILKSEPEGNFFNNSPPPELVRKLTAFGREWQVDVIFLLQTSTSNDWIYRSTGSFVGFGHFSRLGFGENLAYGVFWLRVFDCKAGKFVGDDWVRQAQVLPGVDWHDSWPEYIPEERRGIIRGLEAMIKESVPALLSKAHLTDAKIVPSDGPRPKSYVPEGNELEIPEEVSKKAARIAVLNGFKDRDWVLQTNSGDRMVGVYRDGKKEARCTVTFTDHSVLLAPEGHAIPKDWQPVPVGEYHRWYYKLKESIIEALVRRRAYVPEGNEFEIPEGVSKQAARTAVLNGLKERDWVVQTNSGDRLVGVYRHKKKEALCTFTFTDHSIVLVPEGHEIQKDGQLVPVEYYHGWHDNLKESIADALMKAPLDTSP